MPSDPPLVAVVDDDDAIRKALDRVLRACGFQAQGFASGEALLRALPSTRPDCVLLDLRMPEMDGMEVLRRLRTQGSAVPVIVITAHDEPGARARCLEFGASAYLAKPIDAEALRQAIAEAMR